MEKITANIFSQIMSLVFRALKLINSCHERLLILPYKNNPALLKSEKKRKVL